MFIQKKRHKLCFRFGYTLFYCALLCCTLQLLQVICFCRLKVCGISTIFPIPFACFVSLCLIFVILTLFHTFSLLFYLLWSVIFDVTAVTCWSFTWGVASFSSWKRIFIFFIGHALWHAASWFPGQGLNLRPRTVEAWSLNHWPTREVPVKHFLVIGEYIVF